MISFEIIESSLVIPLYNEESSLPALFSCLSYQSHLPSEIIFVDCDSSDFSLDLIHKFISTFSASINFQTLSLHSSPRSAAAARNFGLIHASHTTVFFLDCGVNLFPDSFYLLYHYFEPSSIFMQSICTFLTYPFQSPFELAVCSSTYGFLSPKPSVALSLCAKDSFIKIGAFDPLLVSGEDQELRSRYKELFGNSLPCLFIPLIEYSSFKRTFSSYLRKQIYYQRSTYSSKKRRMYFRVCLFFAFLLVLFSLFSGFFYILALAFSIAFCFFSFFSPFLRSKSSLHFFSTKFFLLSILYSFVISFARNFVNLFYLLK